MRRENVHFWEDRIIPPEKSLGTSWRRATTLGKLEFRLTGRSSNGIDRKLIFRCLWFSEGIMIESSDHIVYITCWLYGRQLESVRITDVSRRRQQKWSQREGQKWNVRQKHRQHYHHHLLLHHQLANPHHHKKYPRRIIRRTLLAEKEKIMNGDYAEWRSLTLLKKQHELKSDFSSDTKKQS